MNHELLAKGIYGKMQKEMENKERLKMERPEDPRPKVMYPGMNQPEHVMDAVDKLRDKEWETLNDKIRNNDPATPEEIADLLERKPWINSDNPELLEHEVQQSRKANLMYLRSGKLTFEEIERAKNFVISDGITPEQKKFLEKSADKWHAEHGSFTGWAAERERLISELVEGKAPVADLNKEAMEKEIAEIISKYLGK
ncbi:MAG: hypothetical protein AB1424_08970 [Thermodesulfobacteriota bacterium]